MREISTVNMKHDGAESIQWNWKTWCRPGCAAGDGVANPFNGIERLNLHHLHPLTGGKAENPFNGIESTAPSTGNLNPGCPLNPFNGIERPSLLGWGSSTSYWGLNPFNGIESIRWAPGLSLGPGGIHSMELKAWSPCLLARLKGCRCESIQWNWKPSGWDTDPFFDDRGIHSMELKEFLSFEYCV